MNCRLITVDTENGSDLFEDSVANLVVQCQGLIKERLQVLVSTMSSDVLANRLWLGEIRPAGIGQAVLGAQEWHSFLAALGTELSSLAAGVFHNPVMLKLASEQQELADQTSLIEEQLDWGQETYILSKILMNACHLVWQEAVSDYAWPIKMLKPGKLLWRFLGSSPEEEERRSLQELTQMIEGVKVNLQKRLFREISIQVVSQVWSLYDVRMEKRIADIFMDSEWDNIA